eukprot:scaffold5440_cov32-Tisochrysis_lutea.AAC.9
MVSPGPYVRQGDGYTSLEEAGTVAVVPTMTFWAARGDLGEAAVGRIPSVLLPGAVPLAQLDSVSCRSFSTPDPLASPLAFTPSFCRCA